MATGGKLTTILSIDWWRSERANSGCDSRLPRSPTPG
ncbi:hypothetical protein CCACVL1_00548 [Corchorus capsularis]|uniref:Uncharacterized protein n=1 Tax=Corchorus capsularis TaxID=210143 RepID=A0A1R3KWK6_COCAP|nr:hypothetical protein CCACVL1_00548 [Corchorus capsularis]